MWHSHSFGAFGTFGEYLVIVIYLPAGRQVCYLCFGACLPAEA